MDENTTGPGAVIGTVTMVSRSRAVATVDDCAGHEVLLQALDRERERSATLARNVERLAFAEPDTRDPAAIERGMVERSAGGLWVCPACNDSIAPGAVHYCKNGGARPVRVQNAPATRGWTVDLLTAMREVDDLRERLDRHNALQEANDPGREERLTLDLERARERLRAVRGW